MKRVILLAVIQAVVLFFIIGHLPMPLKAISSTTISSCLCPYCRCLALWDSLLTEIVLPRKAAEIAEKRKAGNNSK